MLPARRCTCPVVSSPSITRALSHNWKDWLPKHIANHKLEPTRLSEIHVRYRLVKTGHEIIVSTTDDRGKEHKVFVHA